MKRFLNRLFRQKGKDNPSLAITVHEDRPPEASLEGLPTELKILILNFIPDIPTLHYLVRSSPLYHNAYLSDRERILNSVLLYDMSPEILVEALATSKASKIDRDSNWSSKLRTFLRSYKYDMKLARYPHAIEKEDIFAVANLHSVVHAITEKYSQYVLSLHPVTNQKVAYIEPITENERDRIHRSLYRFQTFCTLFADDDAQPSYRPRAFNARDMSRKFLMLYEPWEGEELACVFDFLFRCYNRCLGYCGEEIHELDIEKEKEDLRFMGRDESQAEEHVQKRNEPYYSTQIEIFAKQGLHFFLTLSRQYGPEKQWEVIKDHIISEFDTTGPFLSLALRVEPYNSHYQNIPTYDAYPDPPNRYDSALSGSDGPTAAWIWHSNGRAKGQYTKYAANNHRAWGYVIWDYERLDNWGILEVDPHFRDEKEGWKVPQKNWVCEERVIDGGKVVPDWKLVVEKEDPNKGVAKWWLKKGLRYRVWMWSRERRDRKLKAKKIPKMKSEKSKRAQLKWNITDRR